MLGAETHDTPGWSESSTTRTDLGCVKEEEAGVEKCHCAGLAAYSVLSGHVGLKDTIDDMKKAETQTITGVRVEVADLVIVAFSYRGWRNAHKQDRHVPPRIRHLVGTKRMLDKRGPTIKAFTTRGDALFAYNPVL